MSSDSYDGHPALKPPTFDFGEAIRRLKAGFRVHRAGWNGKGMWLILFRPRPSAADLACGGWLDGLPAQPYIAMRTADAKLQPGWLASQADMLAEDWSEAP